MYKKYVMFRSISEILYILSGTNLLISVTGGRFPRASGEPPHFVPGSHLSRFPAGVAIFRFIDNILKNIAYNNFSMFMFYIKSMNYEMDLFKPILSIFFKR